MTRAWSEQCPYCSGTMSVQFRRRHWLPSSRTTCSRGGSLPASKSQTTPVKPRAEHSWITS